MSNIMNQSYLLPTIKDIDELSFRVGISKYKLYNLSLNSSKYYKKFEKPKKNGGMRIISAPSRGLKALQAWVLKNILYMLPTQQNCKGFRKGTSILDNVEPHRDANIILNLDILNFYESVQRKKVFLIFKNAGYNNTISTILTNICTLNNCLPQGSPCSPQIANLVCINLDKRIQGFVGSKGIIYTRYADDLTFSCCNPIIINRILPTISNIVNSEGFNLNNSKTRIAGACRQKKITGLIISNGRVSIGRKKYRELRSMIYNFAKNSSDESYYRIEGWLNYLNSVDKPYLEKLIKLIQSLYEKGNYEKMEQFLLTISKTNNTDIRD